MADRKIPVAPPTVRAAGSPPAPKPPVAADAPSRHGALARKLSTYSNYKSWAEKMRATWADEPATTDASGD